jgi:hypothetical protein
MRHVCRRLSQRSQATGTGELLAQNHHLPMTVRDLLALLAKHFGGRLDADVYGFVQAFEPSQDVVQSPRNDADFVQTVDRHAGVQLAGGSLLHRLPHARESPVDQQPCRLIDQERREQDAAHGKPERRLDLMLEHAETEPAECTDDTSGDGDDGEPEPDAQRESGHNKAH